MVFSASCGPSSPCRRRSWVVGPRAEGEPDVEPARGKLQRAEHMGARYNEYDVVANLVRDDVVHQDELACRGAARRYERQLSEEIVVLEIGRGAHAVDNDG